MTKKTDIAFERSAARLRRVFLGVLALVAALLMVVVPGMQILLGWEAVEAETQARIALIADRLSSYAARRPETWRYQDVRLKALGRDLLRGGGHIPIRAELTDLNGGLIVEFEEPLQQNQWLSLTVSEAVTDGGVVAARLTAVYGLDFLIRPALSAFAVGAACLAMLWAAARLSVLRLLDRALDELHGRSRVLAAQVAQLEQAREELSQQLLAREQDHKVIARHAAALKLASDDFAHVAQISAHHLQEPLRSVMSYSQLLLRLHRDGNKAESGREYVSYIGLGINRMKARLRALASYAALREADFTPELLDVGLVLDDAITHLSRRINHADAYVVWDDLPMVQAPKRRLTAIFVALIEASLRRCIKGVRNRISVSTNVQNNQIVLLFQDNGTRLSEHDRARVFDLLVHDEPGEQVMGLAPARLAAFLMGGGLELAEQSEDCSVCFLLTLPQQD